mgnify:CR=1 FL=1
MGITPQQLDAIQQRLAGKETGASPVSSSYDNGQVILGIDPSLRGTGYGVIDTTKTNPFAVLQGTIKCPAKWPISRCLVEISNILESVIKQTNPTVAAIEGLFYAQNAKTALVMGQARGAALTIVAKSGLDVFEIAPRKVKQAIVGYGAAQKDAVAKMIKTRLALSETPSPDEADALAIALTFAQSSGSPIPDKAIKHI